MQSFPVSGWVIAIGIVVMFSGWAIYIFNWDPIGIREVKNDFCYKTVLVTNKDGQISATPDILSVGPEDRIRWKDPSGGNFRIEFENQEFPFIESKFSAEEANKYRGFRDGTPLKDYKYSIFFGANTLDPIIRIEQDPPPGSEFGKGE